MNTKIDFAAIEEAVLALFYLTLHDHNRAWKSVAWDTGLIDDPMNKAKSGHLE